jgi:hypothetical protein
LNCGSTIACTAAISNGMCFGRHPAITAFAAMSSTVATPILGATMPTI